MTVTEARRSLEEQFDSFCAANSFESILNHFNQLCALAVTTPTRHPWAIYTQLHARLKCYWKAAALFERLEKRVRRPEYMHQTACSGLNVSGLCLCLPTRISPLAPCAHFN
ncbi:unnamed protein product [Echinostoma caproni]|uniref:TPR_REGION domain-containing protein n=1 Tax=Echinostoma caproni TaxID=27848 RepID=A0A183BBQ1_9TREM|nr:unnamed protein product [Echinostoma caproni]